MTEISTNKTSRKCSLCGNDFEGDGRNTKRCNKQHYRECLNCMNEFLIEKHHNDNVLYCSKKCSNNSRKRKNICPVCSTVYNKRSKTCSVDCANKLREKNTTAKELVCEYCGASFLSQSPTAKYCDDEHHASCVVCGMDYVVSLGAGNHPKTCGKAECISSLINSEDANVKRMNTSLRKYGTMFPQQSPIVKNKIVASNLEKYGCEWSLSSPVVREKIVETNMSKYGVPHHVMSSESKNKIVETNLRKYGVPNVFMVPEIQQKAAETLSERVLNGEVIHSRVSKLNRLYGDLLAEHFGVEITFEKRFGENFYADICVGDSILLDINPTITHNSLKSFACVLNGCILPCAKHHPLPKDYHRKRAESAAESNLKLIQWYDWFHPRMFIKVFNYLLKDRHNVPHLSWNMFGSAVYLGDQVVSCEYVGDSIVLSLDYFIPDAFICILHDFVSELNDDIVFMLSKDFYNLPVGCLTSKGYILKKNVDKTIYHDPTLNIYCDHNPSLSEFHPVCTSGYDVYERVS